MRKRFYFHFNKPESRRQGKVLWTIHMNKTCFIVDKVICLVETESKIRKTQPFAVIQGYARQLYILNDNTGLITDNFYNEK